MKGDIKWDIPGDISGVIPGDIKEDMKWDIPSDISGDMPGDMLGYSFITCIHCHPGIFLPACIRKCWYNRDPDLDCSPSWASECMVFGLKKYNNRLIIFY